MHKLLERLHDRLDWHDLPRHAHGLFTTTLSIQAIPAPTFDEHTRAAFVRAQMQEIGLKRVEIDDKANVFGFMNGKSPDAPHILVTAHTDTVFSADTDLTPNVDGGVVSAPGIGDNSIGVASLLALARFLHEKNITPACPLWFIATSREEGLGDLGGMKAAFQRLMPQVGAVINIEGLALGHVYNGGIAVRRLRIAARAEGGHSWLHFGRVSAIHELVALAARICTIRPPENPRTTFNIGMISGGTTINSIATQAEFWLDLRSETSGQLEQLEMQVRQKVAEFTNPELTLNVEVVGDRPAGRIPIQHPLVEHAVETLRLMGLSPTIDIGSTDANIPLSLGCPAVTIGITRGGNAHRTDEFIEIEPIQLGLRQLILLTLIHAQYTAGLP